MKKIRDFVAVTVVLATLAVAGCSSGTADAQKAFDNIMAALQTCDKSKIDEYYSFSELSAYVDKAAGEELEDAVIGTLSDMSYRINSAMETKSGAVVLNVEITTLDFSAVMDEYIDSVITLVESSDYKAMVQSMTESEYQRLMAEKMISALDGCRSKTASRTLDVTMVKIGDSWKLGGASDEFLGALFADMSAAVSALI